MPSKIPEQEQELSKHSFVCVCVCVCFRAQRSPGVVLLRGFVCVTVRGGEMIPWNKWEGAVEKGRKPKKNFLLDF